MAYIDLHTHSTYSDGTLKPAALVDLAVDSGLQAIALTDHDTVAGVDEALAQGRTRGLEVVPGVEISSRYERFSLHILGYGIQHQASELRRRLLPLQTARQARNLEIIQRLNQLGIPASMEELNSYSQGGQLGRPHIARLLIAKKVVRSADQAFARYLRKGARAYVENFKLPAEQAISLIRDAGGLAVLAHPVNNDPGFAALPDLLPRLKDLGLEGIEIHHPTHSVREMNRLKKLAQTFGLLGTGGSDFHGDKKHAALLSAAKNPLSVEYALLQTINQRLAIRRSSFLASAAFPP